MENEVKTWLIDISNAIAEINDFLPNKKDLPELSKEISNLLNNNKT